MLGHQDSNSCGLVRLSRTNLGCIYVRLELCRWLGDSVGCQYDTDKRRQMTHLNRVCKSLKQGR